jgi:hypothetical protein
MQCALSLSFFIPKNIDILFSHHVIFGFDKGKIICIRNKKPDHNEQYYVVGFSIVSISVSISNDRYQPIFINHINNFMRTLGFCASRINFEIARDALFEWLKLA